MNCCQNGWMSHNAAADDKSFSFPAVSRHQPCAEATDASAMFFFFLLSKRRSFVARKSDDEMPERQTDVCTAIGHQNKK